MKKHPTLVKVCAGFAQGFLPVHAAVEAAIDSRLSALDANEKESFKLFLSDLLRKKTGSELRYQLQRYIKTFQFDAKSARNFLQTVHDRI